MSATTLSPADLTGTHGASGAAPLSAADLERRYGAANYHPLPVTLQKNHLISLQRLPIFRCGK